MATPTPEVATPSAAPSPTPTVTPDAPPPVEQLVLRPDGIGDLVIGTAEGFGDEPDDMIRFQDDYCVDARGEGYPAIGTPEADAWVLDDAYLVGSKTFAFGTAVVDGLLLGVELDRFSEIRTAEGIGIGSSRAEVEAAYPQARAEAEGFASRVFVVRTDEHQIQIEVLNPDVPLDSGLTMPERPDTVIGMRSLAADAEPRTRWRTDDVFSPCGS